FGRARHVSDAGCVHPHSGRHQGFDARQYAGPRWHRLLSPRMGVEAPDRRLFRADDESNFLSCPFPRSTDSSSTSHANHRRRGGGHERQSERCVMRRSAIVVLVGLLGIIFATIVFNYSERALLPSLAEAYVGLVPRDLGAPNVITGILLAFRAFDTLGEVAVLFLVAAGIWVLFGVRDAERDQAPAHDKAQATPPTPTAHAD